MTQQRKYWAQCHQCGGTTICSECGGKVPACTPFSDWLRKQLEISSKLGFITTNIDYMWGNYKTGRWMLIEEKRHNARPTWSQEEQFEVLHDACRKGDSNYRGFPLLVFENTTPDDGKMFLDGDEITRAELFAFLQFVEEENTL